MSFWNPTSKFTEKSQFYISGMSNPFLEKKILNVIKLFLQAMDDRPAEDRPKPDAGKQAEIAFKLYDKDRDGYITKSEMEKLSKNLSKEQIDKVFARFDADGDGRLSYSEFRKMMNKWNSSKY